MSKINKLIKIWPKGTVAVQSWLKKQGFYRQLVDRYQKSDWIKRIGKGAYILSGDNVEWTGGLFALQYQLDMKIHIAAKTALDMQGFAHFIPLGQYPSVWFLKEPKETRNLPVWFRKYFAKQAKFHCITRHLFDSEWNLGLIEKQIKEYKVLLSTPEKAIMEYLDLVPKYASLEHAALLMEGLVTLRPVIVQDLLESCRSIKVKRLFVYLAEKQNHTWITRINLDKVNFGRGKRVIGSGGKFIKKYGLSLPDINKYEGTLINE